MIPYIELKTLPLLGIDTFLTLVIIGIGVAYFVAIWRGRQYGVPSQTIHGFLLLVATPALIGSNLLQPILYKPSKFLEDPSIALKPLGGISSFGGAISFLIAFLIYIQFLRPKVSWKVLLDIAVQAWAAGWIFGRLGCALVHDHPGKRTTFFMAINYPEGLRHDLGVYEWLFTIFIIVPITMLIHHRRDPAGTQFAVIALLYGPFRLFMDSLRVNEIRYFYWTPGQYCALFLTALGYWMAFHLRATSLKSKST